MHNLPFPEAQVRVMRFVLSLFRPPTSGTDPVSAAAVDVPAASGGFAPAVRPFAVGFCWSPRLFMFLKDISLCETLENKLNPLNE